MALAADRTAHLPCPSASLSLEAEDPTPSPTLCVEPQSPRSVFLGNVPKKVLHIVQRCCAGGSECFSHGKIRPRSKPPCAPEIVGQPNGFSVSEEPLEGR